MLLRGSAVAGKILKKVADKIHTSGIAPGLAVILVGDDIPSHKYVRLKEERAWAVGIHFEKFLFPSTVSLETLRTTLRDLNERSDIHGIIIQLPLPVGFPTDELVTLIDPKKDTDGFHEETLRHFLAGDVQSCPVFPRAIVELIRETGKTFHGERAVAIVNSDLMGRVMAFALALEGLESEYVKSDVDRTMLAEKTLSAKVVVTACGIPDLVTSEMLSSDAIVIDGGNVFVDEKVRGDIRQSDVEQKVAWLSPVPGGVGPVTVATLLSRVADAAIDKA